MPFSPLTGFVLTTIRPRPFPVLKVTDTGPVFGNHSLAISRGLCPLHTGRLASVCGTGHYIQAAALTLERSLCTHPGGCLLWDTWMEQFDVTGGVPASPAPSLESRLNKSRSERGAVFLTSLVWCHRLLSACPVSRSPLRHVAGESHTHVFV